MADCDKNAAVEDVAKNLTFTPVKSSKSPSPVKSAKSFFDPSIRKKVINLVIDLHGIVQKWEALNQTSFQALNSLTSTYTQLQALEEEENGGKIQISSDCWRNYKAKLLQLRESLIKDHKEQMKQFKEFYSKAENIVNNLEAIALLNKVSNETEDFPLDGDNVMFSSWSAHDIHVAARFIFNCYTKEFLFKQEMSSVIALEDSSKLDASSSSLVLSIWLQQPFLVEEADLKLENMLIECGLK